MSIPEIKNTVDIAEKPKTPESLASELADNGQSVDLAKPKDFRIPGEMVALNMNPFSRSTGVNKPGTVAHGTNYSGKNGVKEVSDVVGKFVENVRKTLRI